MVRFLVIIFIFIGLNAQAQIVIAVTGGTASGKSYIATRLAKRLGDKRALHLELDNYNDVREQSPEFYVNGKPNWDHPSLVAWRLVREQLNDLKMGKEVQMPVYEHKPAIPTSYVPTQPRPIIILEGIHALNSELKGIANLSIFLEVSENLRFKRRLERDVRERGQTPEQVREIFYSMAVPMQDLFIDPTKANANILAHDVDGEKAADELVDLIVSSIDKLEKGETISKIDFYQSSSGCRGLLEKF